jgi:hypothetical protein
MTSNRTWRKWKRTRPVVSEQVRIENQKRVFKKKGLTFTKEAGTAYSDKAAMDQLIGAIDQMIGAMDQLIGAIDQMIGAMDLLIGAMDLLSHVPVDWRSFSGQVGCNHCDSSGCFATPNLPSRLSRRKLVSRFGTWSAELDVDILVARNSRRRTVSM